MITEPTTQPLIERIRALSHPLEPLATGLAPQGLGPLSVAAVLIDVYGTMFVSQSGDIGVREKSDNATALLQALQAAGFRVLSPQAGLDGVRWLAEEIRRAHAMAKARGIVTPEVDIRLIWKEVLKKLKAKGRVLGADHAEALSLLAVDYECRINPVWPMPGLSGLLAALQKKNIRMGIISNAQFFTPLLFSAFLQKDLDELGFDPSLRIWSYAEGEAKPSTRLYERAADALRTRYSLAPGQVLFIGNDILNDIRPARELGFKTALFAGDRRSLRLRQDDPCCQEVTPDLVITELMQIVQDI